MDLQTESVQELYTACLSLLIYRDVLSDDIGKAFLTLLRVASRREGATAPALEDILPAYSLWFSRLASHHQGWQDYVIDRLFSVDNAFTQSRKPLEELPLALKTAIAHDLQILQRLYRCHPQQLGQWVNKQIPVWADRLPIKATSPRDQEIETLRSRLNDLSDWATLMPELNTFYRRFGTGIFAQYEAFRWQQGAFVPIATPDPIALNTLVGYDTQRETLTQNTEFLLKGLPALHVLLYGSRGSGKSSLIKALLSQYRHQGLRLIEVGKAELHDLPNIVERLRSSPQKFVIFVDDLSFEEDDDAYKALKVVLEGNLTARPENVVVYATSNRRHLIREFYGDRPRPKDADEIHQWDTLQEKLSFSDRFGLTLTFEPADQTLYLKMVHHLAQQAEISIAIEELEFRALQWATRHNGRSGRTARQFIDFLQSEVALR